MSSSIDSPKGRYGRSGATDVYRSRLGWWERTPIGPDETDLTIVLGPQHEGRPDLVAFQVYGDERLGWVLLMRNNIVDPIQEMQTGAVMFAPTPSRVINTILARKAITIRKT